jgi:sarcosine oxidase subunit gamma
VTDYQLIETAALKGAAAEAKGAKLREETGFAVVAMTTRSGKAQAMTAAFKKHFRRSPPGAKEAITSGKAVVLPSALGQVFVTEATDAAALESKLAASFSKSATLTDQSDAWVRLALTGPRAAETLERLSMVDLSPQGFDQGQVARTVFEHINVIVMRDKPMDGEVLRYIILTPRSSAEDLLHALLESPPFRE